MPRFSTHTTRHLCLTDLARMGWELHAIATFAGHRSHRLDAALHPPVRPGPGREAERLDGADPRLAGADAHRARMAGARRSRDERRAVAGRVRPPAVPRLALRRHRGPQATTAGANCSTVKPPRIVASGPAPAPQPGPGHPAADRPALERSRAWSRRWTRRAARSASRRDSSFRRAGAQAAAIVLQHCADLGRS